MKSSNLDSRVRAFLDEKGRASNRKPTTSGDRSSNKEASGSTTVGRIAAENLECLAIAIVMALLLKYFLIEAYKIPTGSMQPTIIGDSHTGIFDRVLVNKLSYLIDEPERWDVIVFKYPLDLQKNYIKRMIGLENEQIRIARGDIFVAKKKDDGTFGEETIARKPRAVRESVLKTVFPGPVEGQDLGSFFRVHPLRGDGPPPQIEGDTIRISLDSPARIQTNEIIRDRYYHGYHPEWMGIPMRGRDRHTVTDIGIPFALSIEEVSASAATRPRVEITIGEGDIDHKLVLDGEGAGSSSSLSTGQRAGADPPSRRALESLLSFETGTTHELGFLNIDDQLILEIDGDEVATLEYETENYSPVQFNALTVEIEGLSGALTDIEVVRDTYYLAATNRRVETALFVVPDGHFLPLGDNTQNSSDGREWQLATYVDVEGKTVEGNYFPEDRVGPREDANPRRVEGSIEFRDIYGEPHDLGRDTSFSAHKKLEPYKYVKREYLLGKAMAVFWPIPPFSPTFRWKLIR